MTSGPIGSWSRRYSTGWWRRRCSSASPIAKVSVGVDPVEDRVREIVVPDFTFIEMLSNRLQGEDRLVFELLLGTGGRRSEVAGIRTGDVDLPTKRVWIRSRSSRWRASWFACAGPRAGITGPSSSARSWPSSCGGSCSGGAGRIADEPLILSHRGAGLRWNNYLKRTFRPAVESTALCWAAVERERLVTEEGLSRAEARMRAVREAERLKNLTPHHLRHTAAALLWAAGGSDLEVQLTLGHRDIETSKTVVRPFAVGRAGVVGGAGGANAAVPVRSEGSATRAPSVSEDRLVNWSEQQLKACTSRRCSSMRMATMSSWDRSPASWTSWSTVPWRRR